MRSMASSAGSRSCARHTSKCAAVSTLQRRHMQVRCAVKKSSEKQVVCSKTLHVAEGHLKQVDQLCRDVTSFSHRRMLDRSNGIVQFDCFQDNFEPNVIHFYERYDSNASLGRHSTTEEVKNFMDQVQPLLTQPVGLILYSYNNGQLGCMALQGGPKGEGGLDDATGASGAAGGAGLKQTSNTVDLTKVKQHEDDFVNEAMTDLKKSVKDISSNVKNIFEKMLAGAGRK